MKSLINLIGMLIVLCIFIVLAPFIFKIFMGVIGFLGGLFAILLMAYIFFLIIKTIF
jgi:hypothetical protein